MNGSQNCNNTNANKPQAQFLPVMFFFFVQWYWITAHWITLFNDNFSYQFQIDHVWDWTAKCSMSPHTPITLVCYLIASGTNTLIKYVQLQVLTNTLLKMVPKHLNCYWVSRLVLMIATSTVEYYDKPTFLCFFTLYSCYTSLGA